MNRKNNRQQVKKITGMNRLFQCVRNSLAIEVLLKLSMVSEVVMKVATATGLASYVKHVANLMT